MDNYKKDQNGVYQNCNTSELNYRKQFHFLLKRLVAIEKRLETIEKAINL